MQHGALARAALPSSAVGPWHCAKRHPRASSEQCTQSPSTPLQSSTPQGSLPRRRWRNVRLLALCVSRSSSRAALPVAHRASRDLAERYTSPRHLLEEALTDFSKPSAELDAWMQRACQGHCRSALSCFACDSSDTAVVGVDALVTRGSRSCGHCAPAQLQGGAPFKPSVERYAVHRWAQPVRPRCRVEEVPVGSFSFGGARRVPAGQVATIYRRRATAALPSTPAAGRYAFMVRASLAEAWPGRGAAGVVPRAGDGCSPTARTLGAAMVRHVVHWRSVIKAYCCSTVAASSTGRRARARASP